MSGEEAEAKSEDEDKTNIQVTKGTKKRLKERRRYKRESYDELINYLMDTLDECQKE